MKVQEALMARSGGACELCNSTLNLGVFEVAHAPTSGVDGSIFVCETCMGQIENPETVDVNHWRCLNDSMWSEHDAVKVAVWRMLHRLKTESWPQDLLDMMYLEDSVLLWAKASGVGLTDSERIVHRDANGVILENGDSVVLIKDLKVKGSSMVAKQGTAVRKISLDRENAEYIEGRVDGQQIVIITKFVKKL
ncbi:PhnA domain-containing protein [Arenibacter sp. GZD96]|uniref:PhnA domain-containing protein n=1 Tax=Aurantibrevibacter litoralis TaxID=3106030 RepID=UPI002AFF948C|nr:PhnA domain-containing protein [Arenibacter sp. GZD-96]MEA1784511.1 PhnA domain-containing protein [Arenibacter sp. GZD-96]